MVLACPEIVGVKNTMLLVIFSERNSSNYLVLSWNAWADTLRREVLVDLKFELLKHCSIFSQDEKKNGN